MKALLLIVRLMSYMPPVGMQPEAPKVPAPGTATLVIADCSPGQTVIVEPGNYQSVVPENGTVVLRVGAQNSTDDPYVFQDGAETHAFNGTAAANQMLTGVCL